MNNENILQVHHYEILPIVVFMDVKLENAFVKVQNMFANTVSRSLLNFYFLSHFNWHFK